MRRQIALFIGIFLAFGGLSIAGARAADAATGAISGVYAALGDSYSSGEGVPPFLSAPAGDTCHRSPKAYSQLLVGTSGFPSTSTFVACSGATIADFYNGMDGEPSQLSGLTSSDSLVSLTLGGNDVGFASTLEACMSRSHCQNTYGATITSAITQVSAQLPSLYLSILAAAPNANVYVLGYPSFISSKPSLLCQLFGLAADETSWMATMTAQFDTAVQQAVQSVGSARLHFVNDLTIFAGQEACSKGGADVNGIVLAHPEYSFHPTAAGQALMASTLASAVR